MRVQHECCIEKYGLLLNLVFGLISQRQYIISLISRHETKKLRRVIVYYNLYAKKIAVIFDSKNRFCIFARGFLDCKRNKINYHRRTSICRYLLNENILLFKYNWIKNA